MKISKIFFLIMILVFGNACTLDLLEDPNNVKMDGARATLLLNAMQRNLAGFFGTASFFGMQMTRQANSGGVSYFNVYTPQTFDGLWTNGYANILQDGKAVTDFADENGWSRHAGMARVIEAYTLVTLVDFFGDVPFSEAFGGLDNLNPSVDDDADLYTTALALLDQAELDLKTPLTTNVPPGNLNPLAETPQDQYYANSYTSWLRLINSLKLKIYLNLRLTDPTAAAAGINAAIADSDGLITTQAQNFVFRYGTNLTDPDSRHPLFINNYPGGGGNYMSNYLMWQMFHGYDARQNGAPGDPRLRFYFYRQTNTNSTNPNEIRCVTATTLPSHYPQRAGGAVVVNGTAEAPPGISLNPANSAWSSADGTLSRTFCYPTDRGYWGRDHVNNEGIPPDGLLRTAWGVYPAGGRFDNNVNQGVNATTRGGMFGAGFQPIMMRSFVQFMLAEASLFLGTTGTASTYFRTGIQNSMDDVRDWAVNGTFGIGSAAATEANVGTGSPASVSINAFYPSIVGSVATTNVRAATTGNLAALSGNITVDGVALVDGDRILVKNQTTASQNGIYDVAAGAWVRSTSSDAGIELVGQAVTVSEGTVNINTKWVQTTTGSITIGTTAIVWGVNYRDDVANYVASAEAAYAAQTSDADRMNYIAREYWIAAFCNGVENYNLYRRTGRPTGMQPTLDPAPGDFPRTFFYPNNFATLNNTVEQKTSLSGRVFWDNNQTNLNY
jgi:hypothetical protein